MNESERLLTIYFYLESGKFLSKSQLADEFSVSLRTIQRDFSLLSDFIEKQSNGLDELVYDPKIRKRYLKKKSKINKKDILVISKMLLENRAFNKTEINTLLDKLLFLVSPSQKKEISQIISSERINYFPISNQQNRIDKIWNFTDYIRYEKMLNFNYTSPYRKGIKVHDALPVAIYYDDHYFYLKAYDLERKKYLDFRVDRILEWKDSIYKKPDIQYRNKFRDGDVRNYKVDAFSGELITVRIIYRQDPEIIKDKFPNSEIVRRTPNGYEILIRSQYTIGLKRFLISQLDELIVISPQKLVDDITDSLNKIKKYYPERLP